MSGEFRTPSIRFGTTWTPAVRILIISNGAVFVLQEFLRISLAPVFGLVPVEVVRHFAVWQLITYMFLHGGFLHVAFNMFALWMFGSQLEQTWGTKKFVRYYFITGIGAGLINVAFNVGSSIPTIGASGAIFGLLLAYGVTFPNNLILLYFFIPIKAKYFVLIFAALEFLMARSYTTDGVAHFAHLGGMAIGLVYLKGGVLLHPLRSGFKRKRTEVREARQVKLEMRRLADIQAIRSEVDYLLGRISRVGYENLTDEEKERLEEASRLLRIYSEEPDDLS
jgi:membrane associated rhomboid family serine protease